MTLPLRKSAFASATILTNKFRTKQYKDRIKSWKIHKIINTGAMRSIVQIQTRRRELENKGRKTAFIFRNRPVSEKKIDDFVKRQAEKGEDTSMTFENHRRPTPNVFL